MLPSQTIRPLNCFAVYPTNKLLVTVLKRGERGFWASHLEPTPEAAQSYVDIQNKQLRLTPADVEEMLATAQRSDTAPYEPGRVYRGVKV